MPSAGVVERLEVVGDAELGLTAAGEPATGLLVEQLAFQGREDALGEGVEAVRDAAHAGQRPVPAQLPLQGVRVVFGRRGRCDGSPRGRCRALLTAVRFRRILATSPAALAVVEAGSSQQVVVEHRARNRRRFYDLASDLPCDDPAALAEALMWLYDGFLVGADLEPSEAARQAAVATAVALASAAEAGLRR